MTQQTLKQILNEDDISSLAIGDIIKISSGNHLIDGKTFAVYASSKYILELIDYTEEHQDIMSITTSRSSLKPSNGDILLNPRKKTEVKFYSPDDAGYSERYLIWERTTGGQK